MVWVWVWSFKIHDVYVPDHADHQQESGRVASSNGHPSSPGAEYEHARVR